MWVSEQASNCTLLAVAVIHIRVCNERKVRLAPVAIAIIASLLGVEQRSEVGVNARHELSVVALEETAPLPRRRARELKFVRRHHRPVKVGAVNLNVCKAVCTCVCVCVRACVCV